MLFGNSGKPAQSTDEISLEAAALIMEAAIIDNTSVEELQAFLENHSEVNDAKQNEILLEKNIVRLDKMTQLKRAQKVACFTIAKERNDPQMRKLLTVWRMERFLEAALLRKYGNEALRRARAVSHKAASSKSSTIKNVASRINSQLSSNSRPPTIQKTSARNTVRG